MAAYYNEVEPYCVEWLKNLIVAGLIAPGDVDERSIEDVRPDDLAGYTQCHFFAGIGGWSHALRLAGWEDDRRVWSASCPCQPFSVAGKGSGTADKRHLWPAAFHIIEQCRPDVVFGEQVEAAIRHGWLDLVQTDMEAIGYAFGASGIPAAGVGAPHIRARLYFVADSMPTGRPEGWAESGRGSVTGSGQFGVVADTELPYGPRFRQISISLEPEQETKRCSAHNYWTNAEFIGCADRKARPVEPGTFPLAHGVSARVGKLRAYGNAIVPQAAEAFIRSYLDVRG